MVLAGLRRAYVLLPQEWARGAQQQPAIYARISAPCIYRVLEEVYHREQAHFALCCYALFELKATFNLRFLGYIAYAERAHGGPCSVQDTLIFNAGDVHGGIAASPPIPEFSEPTADKWTRVRGIDWAPDGVTLAFGVQRVGCSTTAGASDADAPSIYTWDTRIADPLGTELADFGLTKIAEGGFPAWVHAPSATR